VKVIGKIYPKDAMFFRTHAGEAANGNNGYELSSIGGAPHVTSKQTGKQFVIPWKTVLQLAIKAGIDK
jgi:hypothetical protein